MNRLMLLITFISPVVLPQVTRATLLYPNDFPASSGFASVPGSYTVNTDTLLMSGPMGFAASGVLNSGIAVFSFTDFFLGVGADISTLGSRPAAILSRGDMTVAGNGIRALAGGGLGGEPRQMGAGPGGGFPGFNFFGGAGGGGGFGGMGGRGQFESSTFDFPGDGGPAYGDLNLALQGGSGGGGGKDNTGFESAGGAGGGGLELAANGEILIAGAGVNADGLQGAPRNSNHTGGGGGSGGGLILHAPSIMNTTLIAARGGRGGDGVFQNGGGGGGGRILIQTLPGGFVDFGVTSVGGGTSPSDFFGTGSPGQPGVLTIQIPEPSSIVGFASLIGWSWLGMRAKRGGARKAFATLSDLSAGCEECACRNCRGVKCLCRHRGWTE